MVIFFLKNGDRILVLIFSTLLYLYYLCKMISRNFCTNDIQLPTFIEKCWKRTHFPDFLASFKLFEMLEVFILRVIIAWLAGKPIAQILICRYVHFLILSFKRDHFSRNMSRKGWLHAMQKILIWWNNYLNWQLNQIAKGGCGREGRAHMPWKFNATVPRPQNIYNKIYFVVPTCQNWVWPWRQSPCMLKVQYYSAKA